MDQNGVPRADGEISSSGRLSLVVPTYNERANITGLIAAVSRVLEGLDWEIVIVDDDSPDRISAIMIAEHAALLVEKLSRGFVPGRFVLFCMVGSLGIFIHMLALWASRAAGAAFEEGQIMATLIAILFNFGLNNEVIYRRWRLSGTAIYGGVVSFCIICWIGALANLSVAELALAQLGSWPLAGLSGALIGGIINFAIADNVVWQVSRRRHSGAARSMSTLTNATSWPESLVG